MSDTLIRGTPGWWLQTLTARLRARHATQALHQRYYDGEQRQTFLLRKLLEAFGDEFRGLNFNYCAVVVDALAERLEVQGFRFGSDDRAAGEAWNIWQRNQLDARFARGLRGCLIKGEASLMVWADAAGEPVITVEDGSEVIVATDPASGHRRAALKLWFDADDGRTYATLYLPGALYKYRSKSRRATDAVGLSVDAALVAPSWEPRPVEGEPWPLPNPLGDVPVVPIPNRPSMAGVGTSEIKAIVPIQDVINANLVQILLAGQFSAFRQKWAANVTLQLDPDTGKPVEPWVIAQDRLLVSPPPDPGDPEVRFGEFSQTDLAGYVSVHETAVQAMATLSRTPPHYFLGQSGTFPSGESLRSAETGLVAKARDRQRDDSEPVEEAMRLAFRIKALQPGLSSSAGGRFARWAAMTDTEARWRDPESRTESEHVDALMKQQALGIPDEVLWERVPYSPQEIERIKAIKAAKPVRSAVSPDQANVYGTLIRSGATPDAAASAAGTGPIEDRGLLPVTVQKPGA